MRPWSEAQNSWYPAKFRKILSWRTYHTNDNISTTSPLVPVTRGFAHRLGPSRVYESLRKGHLFWADTTTNRMICECTENHPISAGGLSIHRWSEEKRCNTTNIYCMYSDTPTFPQLLLYNSQANNFQFGNRVTGHQSIFWGKKPPTYRSITPSLIQVITPTCSKWRPIFQALARSQAVIAELKDTTLGVPWFAPGGVSRCRTVKPSEKGNEKHRLPTRFKMS